MFATPSHASYQCLRLDGNGYVSIADASTAGLDMGLSDFMVEARIKSASTSLGQIISKYGVDGAGYQVRMDDDGDFHGTIREGANIVGHSITANLNDDSWHDIVLVFDRSGTMHFFKDGVTLGVSASIAAVGNIDTTGNFIVGQVVGAQYFIGLIDCVRVWNFGYNGLPADYAAYITWRAQGRNVFLDISEYSAGAWNGYADAVRTEVLTDPGLENWTGDALDDWTEYGESAGVRDITDEQVVVHGGSHAAKFEVTNNDGTSFNIRQNLVLSAGKYYSVSIWYHFPTRTAGGLWGGVWDTAWHQPVNTTSTTVDWTYGEIVWVYGGGAVYIQEHFYNETTTGILYLDDFSIKRVGLVAHYKFEGDYTDETSNSNDLTAGGTGNTFPGYTLKREKIISPAWVR